MSRDTSAGACGMRPDQQAGLTTGEMASLTKQTGFGQTK